MSLTIYFNGWGMKKDALPLSFFQENDREVICINYPYEISQEILERVKTLKKLNQIDQVEFFAWSFGVFYLNKFLNDYPEFEIFSSVAINGVSQLMENGMRERVLNLTIKSMNEVNRLNFYEKLEISSQLPLNEFSFLKCDILSLKEELVEFKRNYKLYDNKIKSYLLSSEDKILNFKDMANFCKNLKNSELESNLELNKKNLSKFNFNFILGGHYPFNNFKNFSELLTYMGESDEI